MSKPFALASTRKCSSWVERAAVRSLCSGGVKFVVSDHAADESWVLGIRIVDLSLATSLDLSPNAARLRHQCVSAPMLQNSA